jgi:hypothetical protein
LNSVDHNPRRTGSWVLLAVLLLGLLHGVLYVILIPPWQHYDEPSHFEYVWLAAHRSGLPQPGDYDPDMSRQVVESMLAHDYFKGLAHRPDLSNPEQEIRIPGYSQLSEPPLYYLLAALPLRFMPAASIDAQLYAARGVSLLLYLLAILAGWGAVRQITQAHSALRWMVPLTIALLPGFTDLMTAVNNDAAAVALFSLFLWGSLRLMRNNFSVLNVVWVLVTAGLAYYTKSTVLLAIPLALVVFLFAVLRGGWRRLAWVALIAGVLAGVYWTFTWSGAAFWYPVPAGIEPARTPDELAPVGEYVLALESVQLQTGAPGARLQQLIDPKVARQLSGQPLTIGAWMWANRPAQVNLPEFHVYGSQEQVYTQQVSIGTDPEFYTFTFTPTGETARAWVSLAPPATAPDEAPLRVYYDGLLLTEGDLALQPAEAQFTADTGESGYLGAHPFSNLLRNASAERAWMHMQPWVDTYGALVFPDYGSNSPGVALYTLADWRGAGWYYRVSLGNLLRTFWGKFAWGHVPLLGHKPYRALGFITALGLLGAGVLLWRKAGELPFEELFVLLLAMLGVTALAFVRGSNYVLQPRPVFFPGARYIYPAIIPMVLLLSAGWLEVFSALERTLKFPEWLKSVIYPLLLVGLDVYAVLSILAFYYPG